jgi:methionine-rich copper-binding protein CopC
MKLAHVMRAAVAAALVTVAVPVFAHTKLLSTSPAAGATITNATQVSLTFSEPVTVPLSGIDLAMTAMPGMTNHAPMKIVGFKTAISADGKTLVATFPRALPAGTYRLEWHAVSTDTHRATGNLTFTVR